MAEELRTHPGDSAAGHVAADRRTRSSSVHPGGVFLCTLIADRTFRPAILRSRGPNYCCVRKKIDGNVSESMLVERHKGWASLGR